MSQVLYVHPENHPFPEIVPVGAIAAINRLPVPVRGRFAREVTKDELAAAAVFLLDVHWHFPLAALDATVAAIRRARPGARIAVGGITAAFFDEAFLQRFDVDAVVGGDAEMHLPALVEAWLADTDPGPLPSVRTRRHAPLPAGRIPAADFDALDWLSIDWFPSYRAVVNEGHRAWRKHGGGPAESYYPLLPVARGCRRTCDFCAGSYQRRVFGRGLRALSADALRRNLLRIGSDPELAYVSVYFSDSAFLESLAPGLRDLGIDRSAFVFVCGTPSPEAIDAVRSAFLGRVTFSVVPPWELAPAAGDASARDSRASFEALLRHLDGLARARSVVFQVRAAEPLDPSLLGDNVTTRTGRDWDMARPDEARLVDGESPNAQLARLTEATHELVAARLLRGLVPELARTIPDPFDLVTLENTREHGNVGDAAQPLLAHMEDRIVNGGNYGLAGLSMRSALVETDVAASDVSAWVPATEKVVRMLGELRWMSTLRGVAWEGDVSLPPRAVALVPWPAVSVAGRPVWSPDSDNVRLPALRVPAGTQGGERSGRWGGELVVDRLRLWWEGDDGMRVEATLAHAPPVPDAPRDGGIFGSVTLQPWPASSWPTTIADSAPRVVPEATERRWRLTAWEAAETTVVLSFRQGGEAPVVRVWVTPRPTTGRLLSTERLAWAYRGADRDRFLGELERAVARSMREAESDV